MLFNSFAFLLAFLPAAVALHAAVERWRPDWRLPLLTALSLTFYSYWDWRFLPLMIISIGANWLFAEHMHRTGRKGLAPIAIAANIAVLGLFKYLGFLAGIGASLGLPAPKVEIALPLGISFFTFHHVMYLVDVRRGEAPRYRLIEYTLYIAFFPQVLAGPLVRWREIMHQFAERPYLRPDAWRRIGIGLALLAIGLFKKVFLGDPLAGEVNPVFAAAQAGAAPGLFEAWRATLGFTFQIYMDFSGYTDMALGLALLFGIALPQNFDAPYKAASLREFWRRWHMTLSRFLRDYLYIPLGGSRQGLPMQLWALIATMALGGLWHGAAWTFVIWGLLHGLGLGAGVLWRRVGLAMPAPAGWLLTFLFVCTTWVFFRAQGFDAAFLVLKGLAGLHGLGPAGGGWLLIAAAASVACLGPTAWHVAQKLPPHSLVAMAIGLALALCLFRIGDGGGYEFIYFQF